MKSIQWAIRKGLLVRPDTCENCGTKPGFGKRGQALIHAHHHNGYDNGHELDVQWLCPPCHVRIHNDRKSQWDEDDGFLRELTADRNRARTGWHHTEEARAKIKAKRAIQTITGKKCEPGCKCKRHTSSGHKMKRTD